MNNLGILLFLLLLGGMTDCVLAQTRLSSELDNEIIWESTELDVEDAESYSFMNDGRHYIQLQNDALYVYDIKTGERTDSLVSSSSLRSMGIDGEVAITDYSLSPGESKILLQTLPEEIYRYSEKADYIIYDRENKKASYLDKRGKQMYPAFDPAGERIAYLWKNDIHIKDLESGEITEVTQDGEWNEIINGRSDWVYEEEFKLERAFEWSPDGNYIAFIKFNESEVPQFDMKYYTNKSYPEKYTFKYPKVSETVSTVQVYLFNTVTKVTKALEIPEMEGDFYIPRIKWMPQDDQLIVYYLNRLQNHLQLIKYDVMDGSHSILLDERNSYYINIHDHLTFLPEREQFIWVSEKEGWNHIYLYDYEGNEVKNLTPGNYDMTDFYGFDSITDQVFYQAAKETPLQREVYAVDINSGESTTLEDSTGWNEATFSNTFDYYIYRYANLNSPPVYAVNDRSGDTVRTLEQNRVLKYYQQRYNLGDIEFFDFKNQTDIKLNGWMLKPTDFDENEEYPLLMFTYGGPNSQEVIDNWIGSYYWWFQMLAQKGYVVACIDNRGTGARGEEFRKMTYLELGKYETEDQIEAARYLGDKSYIDDSNIGIFGWSYGGYLSSLCLLKGNDVFSTAVAVAPVTNWKWYDAIYTERYMGLYEDNRKGYDQNAPIFYVDSLKGNYLLVHGMADDNVHFQHTVEMAKALISANKQFDTYFYPNQDHGINEQNMRLHLFNKINAFLDENLKQ